MFPIDALGGQSIDTADLLNNGERLESGRADCSPACAWSLYGLMKCGRDQESSRHTPCAVT